MVTKKQTSKTTKKQKTENGFDRLFDCLSVTSVKVSPVCDDATMGNILAIATVILNDQLVVRGLRVMEGINGKYVAFPNDPFYKGEGYSSIVYPITRALREHIENCVLEKYLYETGNASVKFDVKLTHKSLFGAVMQMEIIAKSETEAGEKAKEKAIETIPFTKDKGEWEVLKVDKTE